LSKKGDVALNVPGRITEVIIEEKLSDSNAKNVFNAIQDQTGTKLLKMMREPGTWKYRAYGSNV
jgi:hypothetical protein